MAFGLYIYMAFGLYVCMDFAYIFVWLLAYIFIWLLAYIFVWILAYIFVWLLAIYLYGFWLCEQRCFSIAFFHFRFVSLFNGISNFVNYQCQSIILE